MNNAIANVTLIKAGAGAGKTHCIQNTLAGWVKDKKVQANRILAVTFTNAAASEMRQRIKLALLQAGQTEQASHLQQAVITTIHAFGLDILQRFAFEQGVSPSPRQLSESEEQYLLAQILSELDSMAVLVDNAERFNYKGRGGEEFKSAVQIIQEQILKVVNALRSIGKGAATQLENVLEQAQAILTNLYGKTDNAETLNSALKKAVENTRNNLPDENTLLEIWGKGNRPFVRALFGIDVDNITNDWTQWIKLNKLGAPTLVKNNGSEHVEAAETVMAAAQQLPRHPGPLEDALDNLKLVITSAMELIEKYQHAKRNSGLVDYADMVGLAYQIMDNDGWLNELANQFDCLIIDEFQDTNPLQYALLDRLHQKGVPVFIVGDLKQAIMGFQGADSRLFAGLLEQHQNTPGAVQELAENWRSTPELMQFINAMGTQLFGDNYTPLIPKLGEKSDLTPVRIMHFDRSSWQVSAGKGPSYSKEGYQLLANQIVSLLQPNAQGELTQVIDKHSKQKRSIRASDIAVLARTKKHLNNFAKVLREQGVNVQMQEDGFLTCPLVSLMLDALQALNNRNDQFAWAMLATSPIVAADPVAALQELLISALDNVQNDAKKPWEKTFEHPLKNELPNACKGVAKQPLAVQLQAITKALNLLDEVKKFAEYEQYRANILRLQQLASEFEQQDEQALLAMGVVGKNAATFAAWLHAMGSISTADVNQQPLANPVATNAVVLATWHSSKGLEWPVVVVLDAEDVPESFLPSVSVTYSEDSQNAEELLANSGLQMLTDFTDKTSKQKMLGALQAETDITAKNLYYVALTRAREQLIIPVLEEAPKKDPAEEKHGQMYESVLAVLKEKFPDVIPAADATISSNDIVIFEKMTAEKDKVERLNLNISNANRSLNLTVGHVSDHLKHSVTPSKHDSHSSVSLQADVNTGVQENGATTASTEEQSLEILQLKDDQAEQAQRQEEHAKEQQQELTALSDIAAVASGVQDHSYQPACDLNALGYSGPANELGVWMHRLYQVHLQQPALLNKAFGLAPCCVTSPEQQQALTAHLDGFRSALETLCGGIKTLHCEVPVTGLNSKGQVISGVIDLLVEDSQNRWWIVDHKTDMEAASKGYWEQLQAYRHILQQTRVVGGCMLNWTRHGSIKVVAE